MTRRTAFVPTLADDLAVALTLAGEADLIAMDRYRAQDLDVQLKPDRTQVTDADKRVERMIRDHLASARPDDAVFGEEFGERRPARLRRRQWIVDPIDGTSNFVRGVPIWGLLLALVGRRRAAGRRGERSGARPALVGARPDTAPGCSTTAANRAASAVSGVDELAEASLSYNSLKGWDDAGRLDNLLALSRAVGRTRAYGDLWSYMLRGRGRASTSPANTT